MRLKDAVNNIADFSPLRGYEAPGDNRESRHTTLDNTLYIYIWGSRKRWEIPISEIAKADSNRIEDWWEDKTLLEFYGDHLNYPALFYNVKIINDDAPLRTMYPTWDLYEGNLILRQVTP